jgi:predicted alpha/beta superfamily hydrolase
MRTYIRFLVVLIFLLNTVYAQNDGDLLSIATYKKIKSTILNEERTIKISLPYGYQTSGKQYPVLFTLDAENNGYANSVGLARFLNQYKIPELIIVGIMNTIRSRDLYSWKIGGIKETTENGADNFLNFISEELIPYIDKNYRTTKYRIIYGASAGGQFAIYSMITKPDLFEAYLASSPALGYSESPLLQKAESFFKDHRTFNKSFYLYMGKTDFISVTQKVSILDSLIRTYTPSGFKWEIKRVEGGHVPRESFYELMIMLFKGWEPVTRPVIIPSAGEFKPGGSISVEITGAKDPVHYTLDGEEPSRSSPIYNSSIQIDKSSILKAKAIRTELQEGFTSIANFLSVNNYRPAKKIKNLKNGLNYKYAEQQFFNTPDNFSDQPKKSGVVPNIDLGIRERNYSYIIQYEGYIKIPSIGQYRFSLFATDTKIFIDDSLIISIETLLPKELSMELCLDKGYHAIRIITNIVAHPDHILKLYWAGPGFKKQEIPPEVLFH